MLKSFKWVHSHSHTHPKTFDFLSYSYYPFSLVKMMMTMMTMMMMVVMLVVWRFSSHLPFVSLLSLGGGSGYVQFESVTILLKSTAPPLLILMTFCSQMKIFPFSFCPFVDLFCTHFQILLKSMRNNLVYNITFSIPEYACTPFLMLLLFVYLQLCGPQMLLIITQHIYGVHLFIMQTIRKLNIAPFL